MRQLAWSAPVVILLTVVAAAAQVPASPPEPPATTPAPQAAAPPGQAAAPSDPAAAGQPATPADEAAGYAWAGACKECHADIHAAWSHTKHATALNRIRGDDRTSGDCIGCHVTGPKRLLSDGDAVPNAGVQCEGCHGPGLAHAEAARAGSPTQPPMPRKVAQATCETCHNAKSPHYRGFFYSALVGFVHKTK